MHPRTFGYFGCTILDSNNADCLDSVDMAVGDIVPAETQLIGQDKFMFLSRRMCPEFCLVLLRGCISIPFIGPRP